MTYHEASILFDMMDDARKGRTVRVFDLIRNETGFSDVRAAFVAAIEDELAAIETEIMLRQTGAMQ